MCRVGRYTLLYVCLSVSSSSVNEGLSDDTLEEHGYHEVESRGQ